MVYHIGFSVREGMNVEDDYIIDCWIPISIRGHSQMGKGLYFIGSCTLAMKVRKAVAAGKRDLVANYDSLLTPW
jgi:hypothetical protein